MAHAARIRTPEGVVDLELRAPQVPSALRVLEPRALEFLASLARTHRPKLLERMEEREARRKAWKQGATLDFLEETRAVREADWRVEPPPQDLERRHVEITGPVDRKMIVNALNSGADVFMADFEDATAPTWSNLVEGQANLMDAVRRTIALDDAASGKRYRLNERTAVLLARPRGLHLPERHVTVDGVAIPGALFDAGLFLFHNARELVEQGSGPYLYLPKLENHREARWWNEVLSFAEERLGLPRNAVRVTVLIETLPAAFEMDEILFELRGRAAGLNCGRWDYIFSTIKTRQHDPAAVLPDRAQVTMEQPALRAYARLLVHTCHRRGAHAMGGMAAQIPIKDDAAANERALERVRADKRREAGDGHDGTWVAHPALVQIAREAFEAGRTGLAGGTGGSGGTGGGAAPIGAADLLAVPKGTRTEVGLRQNARVGMRYLAAWLSGNGCVPIDHLMEDAATAEISRAQVWQWLAHRAALDDGREVSRELVQRVIDDEAARTQDELGRSAFAAGRHEEAKALFAELCFAKELPEFLTLAAYERLVAHENS